MRNILLILAFAFLLLSGCATQPTSGAPDAGVNVLGVVKVEEASYLPPSNNTLALSSDELGSDAARTGRKFSLLWGLITFTDY